jgi:hypothetical protein
VRLLTRKGIDLARRFAQITSVVAALPVRSCIIAPAFAMALVQIIDATYRLRGEAHGQIE